MFNKESCCLACNHMLRDGSFFTEKEDLSIHTKLKIGGDRSSYLTHGL